MMTLLLRNIDNSVCIHLSILTSEGCSCLSPHWFHQSRITAPHRCSTGLVNVMNWKCTEWGQLIDSNGTEDE